MHNRFESFQVFQGRRLKVIFVENLKCLEIPEVEIKFHFTSQNFLFASKKKEKDQVWDVFFLFSCLYQKAFAGNFHFSMNQQKPVFRSSRTASLVSKLLLSSITQNAFFLDSNFKAKPKTGTSVTQHILGMKSIVTHEPLSLLITGTKQMAF